MLIIESKFGVIVNYSSKSDAHSRNPSVHTTVAGTCSRIALITYCVTVVNKTVAVHIDPRACNKLVKEVDCPFAVFNEIIKVEISGLIQFGKEVLVVEHRDTVCSLCDSDITAKVVKHVKECKLVSDGLVPPGLIKIDVRKLKNIVVKSLYRKCRACGCVDGSSIKVTALCKNCVTKSRVPVIGFVICTSLTDLLDLYVKSLLYCRVTVIDSVEKCVCGCALNVHLVLPKVVVVTNKERKIVALEVKFGYSILDSASIRRIFNIARGLILCGLVLSCCSGICFVTAASRKASYDHNKRQNKAQKL